MNFWFLVSIIKKRNDVADVAWGLGFVLLAWISFLQSNEPNVSRQIVTILVTIWGLRLALHISKRHKEGKEDERNGFYRR
jgi:steroid 5-alpha reductase family enzyme